MTSKPRIADFVALAEKALGAPLDSDAGSRLLEIQRDLHRDQDHLVGMLDAGQITAEEYVEHFQTILRRAMAECLIALGEERFMLIFGEAGMMPEGIVDVPTFLASRRNCLVGAQQ